MVKHVIIWKLKDEFKGKDSKKREIKEQLEGLVGKIPGLREMNIIYDPMSGSTGDILMDSYFDDAASLTAYQKNFLHLEIANTVVKPAVDVRLSFDYEI